MTSVWFVSRIANTAEYTGVPLNASRCRQMLRQLDRLEILSQRVNRLSGIVIEYPGAVLQLRSSNIELLVRHVHWSALEPGGPGCIASPRVLASLRARLRVRASLNVHLNSVSWSTYSTELRSMLSTAVLSKAQLLALQLLWAAAEDVPEVFRQLAQLEPTAALSVLQHGAQVIGDKSARIVGAMLGAADLADLLHSDDLVIRERTIALLGSVGKGARSPFRK